ncbi:DmsE family decaheme c-type cytochrome [Roseateles violae]|uniref:DmsE family decaheme c-type cytochrome n=1 Tax=Roseateles violae TaxID=3058042 RepID=A0ABT8DY17_9BURK|nr:DmsE family decaheme c-type cytochrome [Pelomonas sp. PFR6]MDN3922444.1 DmsE family decaheme c-type cytochrome [Pelomonas sp. PFR6]
MKIIRGMGLWVLMTMALAMGAQSARAADAVLKGDAVCTRCHDESEMYPVLSIGKTKHGTAADGRTPTCTSCHGESTRHVQNQPREGEQGRPKPDRVFDGALQGLSPVSRVDSVPKSPGKRTTVPAAELNSACLSCHQGGKRAHWQGSVHENRDVPCTACHQLHVQHDKVRDKQTQPEVCFLCHREQRTQLNRQSHHPVVEGKVACSDCHNPHGTAGVKLLVRDSVVDTCYSCHAEKRGPFIFNHQPVTEDCTLCHNPHGSTVSNLLKSRPPFLCQQCHEPTSHRGNVPGLLAGTGTTAGARGITQARACLNCHTNIHGSNNPTNSSESRSMRR